MDKCKRSRPERLYVHIERHFPRSKGCERQRGFGPYHVRENKLPYHHYWQGRIKVPYPVGSKMGRWSCPTLTHEGLIDDNIGDVFSTRYYAGTDNVMYFLFSFVENVIADMIHHGVFENMPDQNLEHWSRLELFMEALNGGIVRNTGFLGRDAAFFRRCATSAVKEALK